MKKNALIKMHKDLFFYSSFCIHCKEAIHKITKANIRDLFIFVSVDDKTKYNIPNYITHVPSIITKDKQIISENVLEYIDNYVSQNTITPNTLDSGYSTSYTWLTDNGYDNEGIMQNKKNSFLMLGEDTRILAPQESDTSTKGNKFDDTLYEKLVNSRNADDEIIKKNLR